MSNLHELKSRTNPAGYYWGFYERWCKACGICMSVCPKGVLAPDAAGKPECVNIDACINCGLCSILCPDFAIGWTADPLTREQADAPRLKREDIVAGDGKVTVKKIKRD